ncbi:Ammonium transporter 3 member [Lachnellula hyalina]|uniref:Ammonium transporter n=1 Tax=Lachnellula hyalina TaxID=1316788 RepID=A0A8H8QSZ9_9HELO|nr:Ammonium transporter 3 member [Lachnellula hyalina]TVY22223.1 Ammonium transporter 3 member [Lachnellula hyalina]
MSNFTTPWLDTGDNAWQLTAGSLVALQSVPGLVVLYAGFMRSKWAINSAFMAFYAFAATLITWVLWAYKIGFGIYMLPFAGRPGPVVTIAQELKQSELPSAGLQQNFPLSTMIYFQFVFAAITVVIMAGAFLGRMNFTAWMLFVPLWITFSYTIGAYSLWGGGFLFQRGVIDYSGGYVIHLSSGTAGFVGAHWIGPRLDVDRLETRPSNVLGVLVGAGILWIGWNGFNGGDPYAASADAGVAVLNTNVATAMSLLCWTICDIIYYKKPSVLGAVQGMITGLVAITPAAGVVAGWGAICIGFASGTIPWLSMNVMGKKVAYFRKIDDVMGIFHTHCIAGAVGGFCVGLFATAEGCAAFGISNAGGAIDGNGRQVWLQIVGALFVIGWNIVWTSLIMLFIKYVCRIPLRMSDEELMAGDDMVHGEAAYALGPCEAHEHLLAGHYVKRSETGPGELSMGGVTMGHDPHVGTSDSSPRAGEIKV